MAKVRISSNRPSFSHPCRDGAGVDDNFAGNSAGGQAGSSPDSGNKPGPGFDGAPSGVGRAGSSISPPLGVGTAGRDGESSALAIAKAAIRASKIVAWHFMSPN